MKKKIWWIIVICIAFVLVISTWYLYTTGVSIHGTVQDAVTMKPLPGARVQVGSFSYETDDKGVFHAFTSVWPKSTLVITKEGYKPFQKNISFSGILDTKQYDIVVEPLLYETILESTRKDLASYTSYIFKSSLQQQMTTPFATTTYMKYQRNKEGVLYFKILTDDDAGEAVSSKEIITTGSSIYYKTLQDTDWVSFDASEVRGTELQKPEDILLLFSDHPDAFSEGEPVQWYQYADGSISSKPGSDPATKSIRLHHFIASWAQGKTQKEVILLLNDDYRVISGKLHIVSPEGLDTKNPGRMNEQELFFTITNINEDIEIQIPQSKHE